MRKRLDRFCLLIIATALGTSLVPTALAGTIYTTLGPDGAFDTNDFVHFTEQSPPGAYADEFTVPVSANVGSVSLALAGTILGGGATVMVTIRSNTPVGPGGILGTPGGIIGTFGGPIMVGAAGIYTIDLANSIHLNAGTEYWLSAAADSAPVDWFDNDQGIDNVIASRKLGVWTEIGSETALAFSLNSVPEPGSFGLGAVSVVACVWRKRIVRRKAPVRQR